MEAMLAARSLAKRFGELQILEDFSFEVGQDVTGKTGRVSYMQQKDLLLPWRRIIDNVVLPLRIRGMKRRKARREAAPFFADFGLEGFEYSYPAQLSGGIRSRGALRCNNVVY